MIFPAVWKKINEEFRKFCFRFWRGKSGVDLQNNKKKIRRRVFGPTFRSLRTMQEGNRHLLFFASEKKEETGIEISISHPKKRISSLDMLSGGERSLVAISLLFAMSQVNPPPFLILDETTPLWTKPIRKNTLQCSKAWEKKLSL